MSQLTDDTLRSQSNDSASLQEIIPDIDSTPLESDAVATANAAYSYAYKFHYDKSLTFDDKLELNNKLVRELAYHLELMGQNYEASVKKIVLEGNSGYYLTLKLYDENGSDNTRTALNRLAKKVNVKSIHLDLVSNAAQSSGGYFMPKTRELYLGTDYIISKIVFDDVGGVARHELAHAMFENMRKRGQDSIYHTRFIGADGAPMIDFKTGYESYISSEELYNYISNMYWVAKADLDALSGTNSLFFMSEIEGRIDQLSDIAKEIKLITRDMIDQLEVPSDKILLGSSVFFGSAANRYYYKVGEVYADLYSKKAGAITESYNLIDQYAQANRIDFDFDINTVPVNHRANVLPLFNGLQNAESAALTESLEDMKRLNRVARFFEEENKKLKEKFDVLKSIMEVENEKGEERDSEVVRGAFIELRKTLRTFINKSREWHSSFVGIID